MTKAEKKLKKRNHIISRKIFKKSFIEEPGYVESIDAWVNYSLAEHFWRQEYQKTLGKKFKSCKKAGDFYFLRTLSDRKYPKVKIVDDEND